MSPGELFLLAETWEELLRDMSDVSFSEAVKTHCRESKFFPVPADILTAHEYTPSPPAIAIPEHTNSPEEHRRAAVSREMFFASMRGDVRAKEFFSCDTGDWDDKDAIARGVLGEKYPGEKERRRGDVLSVGEAIGVILQ